MISVGISLTQLYIYLTGGGGGTGGSNNIETLTDNVETYNMAVETLT